MFSKQLKIARKNKNLTQEELAEIVDTKKATISNYETGYSEPSLEMLVKLSDKLDVSVDFLLGVGNDNNVYKELYKKELEKQLDILDNEYSVKREKLMKKLSLLE